MHTSLYVGFYPQAIGTVLHILAHGKLEGADVVIDLRSDAVPCRSRLAKPFRKMCLSRICIIVSKVALTAPSQHRSSLISQPQAEGSRFSETGGIDKTTGKDIS